MNNADQAKPAVSVVIPAYNAAEYLEGCLDSVFRQTCEDFEVIVVDDGSTDETPEVLKRYRGRENLRVIRQENAGTSLARNRGINAARGEYLCFVDADDDVEPNYLSDMLARAEQTHADVISSGYTFWKDGKMRGAYPAAKWDVVLGGKRVSIMCVSWTRLYRAEFLREYGICYTPGERFEDVAFSLKVNMLAKSIENIPENNYRYYMRDTSFTESMYRGLISAEDLPRRSLADAFEYLTPSCEHDVLEFYAVKLLAGILFQNLRRNPIATVDAFSSFCAQTMEKYFPAASKNPYISLFSPKSLPFIQRAAMKVFVIVCKMRALRVFSRAFTRL